MKRHLIFSALLCLGLASCADLDVPGLIASSSPGSNERFAVSKAYNDANGFRHISLSEDSYTFYAATDAHISATANGLTRFTSDYVADAGAAPFALFIGDAMDEKNNFGRFLETVRPISACGRTLFCTPGNHDLYFGQWTEYIKEMKTASYCFEVTVASGVTDLFICLDSASGTLGTDQRAWLENVLHRARMENLLSSYREKYRHTVIFTHTHFFKRDNSQGHTSNFNLEEGYDLEKLFSDYGVSLVISGHDHFFEDTYFKDVRFVTLGAINDTADEQFYYTFRVSDGSISLESHKL
ncbi:MAG: metallophosphoesterase [Bacteroidia bacterium]|nr:metallophosphoesterase [Bacteroidia bacterium]